MRVTNMGEKIGASSSPVTSYNKQQQPQANNSNSNNNNHQSSSSSSFSSLIMSGKTSPAARLSVPTRSFYSESPPKRSRLHENNNNLRPAFKSLKENLIKFDKKLCEPIRSIEFKDSKQPTTRPPPSSDDVADARAIPPMPEINLVAQFLMINTDAKQADTNETPSVVKQNSPGGISSIEPSVGPVTVSEFEREQQLFDSAYASDESKSLDRDSPLPLKNLGNTCYENSIIQCLFNLDMFMDNFEQSMISMRTLVQKSDSLKASSPQSNRLNTIYEDNDDEKQHESTDDELVSSINQSISKTTKNRSQECISDSDVRYRIANAFDNLYKCYTQRRIQLAATNLNQSNQTSIKFGPILNSHPSSDENDADFSSKNKIFKSDYGIPESPDTAIPLCKSNLESATSTSHPNSLIVDQTPETKEHPSTAASAIASTAQPETAPVTNHDIPSNLTPIALVSSATAASNEQSELETRLEELKSAVGERSSSFNSSHQQDASEFFYHVIDSIQEFYQSLDKSKDEENPVTKAFELELDYSIMCPKCGHHTASEPGKVRTLHLALPHNNCNSDSNNENNQENGLSQDSSSPTPPTSDLGLDSPISDETQSGFDEKENHVSMEDSGRLSDKNSQNTASIAKLDLTDRARANTNNNPSGEQRQLTLEDALRNYFKDDVLEYSCSQPGCDSKKRTKRCSIRKLPQVLFITLARYEYTGKKNLDEVMTPFELSVPFQGEKSTSSTSVTSKPGHDLHSSVDDATRRSHYQLIAVVCHLGSSLYAGHYTSYVLNRNNLSWYSCDDDSITKVSENEVKSDASKSGYCFFYALK